MNKAVILSLLLMIISCKQNLKNDQLLIFSIDFIALHDDEFQLFYSNDIINTYEEKNSIKIKIKGSEKLQTAEFCLPKNVNPNRIRLDLGNNILQNFLEINNIKIKLGQNKIVLKDKFLKEVFKTNDNIIVDTISNKFNLTVKNKVYDPYIISKNLNYLINKLIEKSHED